MSTSSTPPSDADPGVESPPLPSVAELPDADVVIYDGHCRFCRNQVERLNRWAGGRLAFVSLHDPWVSENVPDLTHEMMMKQMYVISRDGRYFGGAAALRYLSRKLPRLYVLAPLLHIPGSLPVWQWAYQRIAQRRYRIAGTTGQLCDDEACQIHRNR